MRDGTTLVAEVNLPDAAARSTVPAVLVRSPYHRSLFEIEVRPLVEAGFAVVIQSVRGRHGSEGTFVPYFHEGDDGYDSVEWVAGQPWCDGNVAMMGSSYGGWVQWAAAREHPPHLRTFVSSACCARWTGEWPWRNGVLWPGAITWLHMVAGSEDYTLTPVEVAHLDDPPTPLNHFQDRYHAKLPMADDWLKHPTPDGYWSPIQLAAADFAGIDLPVLHITGWFDRCQLGAQFLYDGMRRHSPARDRQALIVGAWDHTIREMRRSYDSVDFGRESVIDFHGERIRWFDRWLRGGPPGEEPSARVFVTGARRWQRLPQFPPDDASHQTWFSIARAPPPKGAGASLVRRRGTHSLSTRLSMTRRHRWSPGPTVTRPPTRPSSVGPCTPATTSSSSKASHSSRR